jgi:hypothetical protein
MVLYPPQRAPSCICFLNVFGTIAVAQHDLIGRRAQSAKDMVRFRSMFSCSQRDSPYSRTLSFLSGPERSQTFCRMISVLTPSSFRKRFSFDTEQSFCDGEKKERGERRAVFIPTARPGANSGDES